MLFLKKSNLDIEQTTKREKTKEKLTSFITKHYKNIIKTSFDN